MKKLNLNKNDKEKSNLFGIPLPLETETLIKTKLESLSQRCPSTAKLNLKFKKEGHYTRGFLTVKNFRESFSSTKLTKNPLSTFLLLEEDIDVQLLDWKRSRFSDSLFNKLCPKSLLSENCA